MKKRKEIVSIKITIHGLVQGVGFRPFIYRLANDFALTGNVCNNNSGVTIRIEGPASAIDQFLHQLPAQAPIQSNIRSIHTEKMPPQGFRTFQITVSQEGSKNITQISPDIAVCEACLSDRKQQAHRLTYPFINCTNCGPRFSIITALPYDRDKTTMHLFHMCETCQTEYNHINDRRYHAQPIACNQCGPHYELITPTGKTHNYQEVISSAVNLIKQGEIIAIKGVGGFHLGCDALNDSALEQLRHHKKRSSKPLAVLFPNSESLCQYAYFSASEQTLLESWQRPIVLLQHRNKLPVEITRGLNTIGAFLPYMPIHYDLFEQFQNPIVLTSGNISDEPICITNSSAQKQLRSITTHFITHNRIIHNRVDDSVAMVVNDTPRILRRSRGYSPAPIETTLQVEGLLATGAELSNTFAIGKESQVILSQHIGDLKNYETFRFYEETINRYQQLFQFQPQLVIHDLHPDYNSILFAEKSGLPSLAVQHHHAHIAACMAEHELDEKVMGVAFDGTGYGTDGNSWGSEFMICDLSGFDRLNHFEYFPLPGGDAAIKEPWRIGLSLLHHCFGDEWTKLKLPFLENIPPYQINTIIQAIQQHINTPLTCSAGRLFDAVAAITGLCLTSDFHAQAPMLLESVINREIHDHYRSSLSTPLPFKPILKGVITDIHKKEPIGTISARFHNTICQIIIEQLKITRDHLHLNKVALSGGCFQNGFILTKLEKELKNNRFEVYTHSAVPANDGGISLGQILIAAKKQTRCV
ncbi:MAG: carbamoyltransferase HypF [Marinilabiliaceae bacterium]|nr:carbamoyltransferase HypF [Marinilabiliaceae bacterium]